VDVRVQGSGQEEKVDVRVQGSGQEEKVQGS
jgi:hypothetical protein